MLPKYYEEICAGLKPTLRKRSAVFGDASSVGAFPNGDTVEIITEIPRRLGAASAELRINRDGEATYNVPFMFCALENGCDVWKIELDTALLCKNSEDGLFYFDAVYKFGDGRSFCTDSEDNVDFSMSEDIYGGTNRKFCMMVYRSDFSTPVDFGGGVMYHIFVDRFFRGKGHTHYDERSVLEHDWENGIPQFAEKPGEHLENNVFFGGNLWGVAEKLPYLKELGVTDIYLSPIFRAYSNHKYDTGNYLEIDRGFGGEAAFEKLIEKARAAGIRIILDGVFNHTGADSLYFNKFGTYDSVGAYNSKDSEYFDWYNFKEWPDVYESWWGIDILPRLNHSNDRCRRFFTEAGGVAEKYIRMGVGGWRLDVADELDDRFLNELRGAVKSASDGNAVIIGEVWENAAEKTAYGKRRKYLRGGQLDSVMNYPLKNALIEYAAAGDAEILAATLTEIWSIYPRPVCDALMNIVGTHDTERILTVLGGSPAAGRSNRELSTAKMTEGQRITAKQYLKMLSAIQYTVYGIPSVYYGDEVGMEGYHDPFCRMPFPWGREDGELLEHYKKLGAIRKEHKAFDRGAFRIVKAERGLIAFERTSTDGTDTVMIAANSGDKTESLRFIDRGLYGDQPRDLLTGEIFSGASRIPPDRALIFASVRSERR